MKCSECFHFAKIDGDDTVGLCLRNPPQVVKDYSGLTSKNPEVGIDWRCGEFRQKDELNKAMEAMKVWQNTPASELIVRNVVHGCPKSGESVTSCCGLNPFELGLFDRLTMHKDEITCKGGRK